MLASLVNFHALFTAIIEVNESNFWHFIALSHCIMMQVTRQLLSDLKKNGSLHIPGNHLSMNSAQIGFFPSSCVVRLVSLYFQMWWRDTGSYDPYIL